MIIKDNDKLKEKEKVLLHLSSQNCQNQNLLETADVYESYKSMTCKILSHNANDTES